MRTDKTTATARSGHFAPPTVTSLARPPASGLVVQALTQKLAEQEQKIAELEHKLATLATSTPEEVTTSQKSPEVETPQHVEVQRRRPAPTTTTARRKIDRSSLLDFFD